jgi:hypothetical protein
MNSERKFRALMRRLKPSMVVTSPTTTGYCPDCNGAGLGCGCDHGLVEHSNEAGETWVFSDRGFTLTLRPDGRIEGHLREE